MRILIACTILSIEIGAPTLSQPGVITFDGCAPTEGAPPNVLANHAECLAVVDEQLFKVQTMLTSPHVGPVQDKAC